MSDNRIYSTQPKQFPLQREECLQLIDQAVGPLAFTLNHMIVDLYDFLIAKGVVNKEEFEAFTLNRIAAERAKEMELQTNVNTVISTEN